MKVILVICILVVGATSEAPAPYAPSGWRPNGPSFELPQKQTPQYLPPLDPRTPSKGPAAADGVDVSVRGLPAQQVPIFQASPLNGQQTSGPAFNADIKDLDRSLQQAQYRQQQQTYREFQRQRELDATQTRSNDRLPSPQAPKQFARTTTEAPTTTEIELNEEEVLNDQSANKKDSVEVTRQNLQEYPPELFLAPFAQLQLQPQFVPLQINGYQQPETSQRIVSPFGAALHFGALPSVISQQSNNKLKPQAGIGVGIGPLSQPEGAIGLGAVAPQNLVPQAEAGIGLAASPLQPQGGIGLGTVVPQNLVPRGEVDVSLGAVAPQNLVPQAEAGVGLVASPLQPQGAIGLGAVVPQNLVPQGEAGVGLAGSPLQPQGAIGLGAVAPQNFIPQGEIGVSIGANSNLQPQGQFGAVSPGNYEPVAVGGTAQFSPQNTNVQPQSYAPQDNSVDTNEYYYPQPSQQPQNQYGVPFQPQFAPQGQVGFISPQNYQPQSQFEVTSPQNYQPQGQFGVATPQNYQPQGQFGVATPQNYQPQGEVSFVAPQNLQPQGQFGLVAPQNYQPQGQFGVVTPQNYQPQFQAGTAVPQNTQPQFITPGQGLQSGLDLNQSGNDIEQSEEKPEGADSATAVATAFGARTQPRVNTRYGYPLPPPRVQANPDATTTESAVEEVSENDAKAVSGANGERKKSARLRSRRIRPVLGIDRAGRLVIAEV